MIASPFGTCEPFFQGLALKFCMTGLVYKALKVFFPIILTHMVASPFETSEDFFRLGFAALYKWPPRRSCSFLPQPHDCPQRVLRRLVFGFLRFLFRAPPTI